MSRNKLCFVAHTTFTVNNYLLEQINGLAEDFEVTVCCGEHRVPLRRQLSPAVSVVWNPLERGLSLGSTLVALFWFLRFFRANRFDAVHSFTSKAGLVAQFAAWVCRVPVRCHTFTGQLWANTTGLRRYFFWCVDRSIVRLSSEVLTDSRSQSRYLEQYGVVAHGQARVLGPGSICGVDLETYRPDPSQRARLRQQLGIAESERVFLYLGRKSEEKGLAHLLEAFSLLAQRQPGVGLLMVGPDEMNVAARLGQLGGHVRSSIHNMPYTDQPHIWMQAADVLCMPSYREGFGLAVIEGAACGLPAVVSDIYGLRDAVIPGVTALCVPPGDAAALATAMEHMLDGRARATMGRAAREFVEEHFDSRRISACWRDFYHTLLGGQPPAGD